jgi:hypothetical protein
MQCWQFGLTSMIMALCLTGVPVNEARADYDYGYCYATDQDYDFIVSDVFYRPSGSYSRTPEQAFSRCANTRTWPRCLFLPQRSSAESARSDTVRNLQYQARHLSGVDVYRIGCNPG